MGLGFEPSMSDAKVLCAMTEKRKNQREKIKFLFLPAHIKIPGFMITVYLFKLC
jgi:hypothetical protein